MEHLSHSFWVFFWIYKQVKIKGEGTLTIRFQNWLYGDDDDDVGVENDHFLQTIDHIYKLPIN